MQLKDSAIQLSNGNSFVVFHNMTEGEFEAAVINWQARTKKYTAGSLCAYINSKRLKGLADFYCYTLRQWKQLTKNVTA
jgi:hypothetical protein